MAIGGTKASKERSPLDDTTKSMLSTGLKHSYAQGIDPNGPYDLECRRVGNDNDTVNFLSCIAKGWQDENTALNLGFYITQNGMITDIGINKITYKEGVGSDSSSGVHLPSALEINEDRDCTADKDCWVKDKKETFYVTPELEGDELPELEGKFKVDIWSDEIVGESSDR